MSTNPLPTPYDIIHPAPPPLVVPELAWWVMIGSFLLIWIIALRLNSRRRRGRERTGGELLIVHELAEILDTFQKNARREELHLFVTRVKREIPEGASGKAIRDTLRKIDALRFSPNITAEGVPLLRKVIDLLRSSKKEET